jgi:DMSO/TMAO reductase YedYZ molybdopterin-dependent catalytic subunit
VDVVFRGADGGMVEGRDEPVRFERSLPVPAALWAGALLAYEMNGAELPPAHGYPLRLVVPGWYAVASVKWLTSIEVIGRPFDGYFQVDRYRIDGTPVTLQRVRSVIVSPAGSVPAGTGVIRGVAWSGAAPIARVDVSVGSGPWQPAALAGAAGSHGWQRWELPVRLAAGTVTLRARATDLAGRCQPDRPAWNPLGYGNNAVHVVSVQVTGP